jgi:hypothetical protein
MKLVTFCYLSAVVGMILTGLGRRLLIIEAVSVSTGWAWAVRLLPLADIMFLARFWDSAKTGAFLSLTGLFFLAPLGVKTLWDEQHPPAIDTTAAFGRLDGDQKSAIFMDIKAEHEELLETKRQRLDRLNVHLGAWYQSMQEKRASIATASPEELAAFNEEAAAYTELREVTKKDDAAIVALMSRKLDGWSSISDEEYAEYQRKQFAQEKKAKHRRGPKGVLDEIDDPGETVIGEF